MRRNLLLSIVLLCATPLGAQDADLRLETVRESLTGTHYRYRQYISGLPVAGGGSVVTVTPAGERFEERALAAVPDRPIPRRATAILNVRGSARFVQRQVRIRGPVESFAEYRDTETGELIRNEPLFLNAKEGRVFLANPVVRLNAPQLRDESDAPGAVPDAAYTVVTLPDVEPAGALRGPWVAIGDFESPSTARADAAQQLFFDRGNDAFEEVNAYFHIDRSQRYLRSLGYEGPLAIAPYAIAVDAHGASGLDNSYYIPAPDTGRGSLVFGDGGTDDAEDPDLLVHEYSHAIQDWIAPGVFTGEYSSESRALGEALGDYWSFSAKYEEAIRSGRDRYCIADWDARCGDDPASERCSYGPGADCLRRVDSIRTYADYQNTNTPGTEHRNGEIVSSALREVFEVLVARHGIAEGKRRADTIVIESLFGAAPSPTFDAFVQRMIRADRLLFGGSARDTICVAFSARGVTQSCTGAAPRGETTVFPATSNDQPIPDNEPGGLTTTVLVTDSRPVRSVAVAVDIAHTFRGDLRIVLIAPDGTEVVLLEPSSERAHGILTVFGRETQPASPLAVLRGKNAAGIWSLRVTDIHPRDAGTLRSWSLLLGLEGDAPVSSRPPATGDTVWFPIAGSVAGANATRFRSDLTVSNSSATQQKIVLVFTPSTADGAVAFASTTIVIPPFSTVNLRDVVWTQLAASGTGQLQVTGNVQVQHHIVTASSGSDASSQAIVAFRLSDSAAQGETVTVFATTDSTDRINAGFANLAGSGGTVQVTARNLGDGTVISSGTYVVFPFSHLQFPVSACGGCRVAIEMQVSGGARVIGYASVVDNASGEAVFFPSVRGSAGSGGSASQLQSRDIVNSPRRTDLRRLP